MSTPEKPRPSLDDTLRSIEALLNEHLAPAGYEFVYRELDGLDEPPVIVEGPMPACDITKLNVLVVEPAHRRSCQHDGPPGPDCPGCNAVDADLAAAKAAAAPAPPERGWLASALHRLFG